MTAALRLLGLLLLQLLLLRLLRGEPHEHLVQCGLQQCI